VNVVLDASDRESENAFVPADAGDVAPELRPDFFCDELLPLFSAEDDVGVVFGESVCRLVCAAPPPPQRAKRASGPRFRGSSS